jgi:hypothetical protein
MAGEIVVKDKKYFHFSFLCLRLVHDFR